MTPPINHAIAVSKDLARRYSADRLSDDELAAFEVHLLDCRQCQQDVAADDRLHIGFRHAGVGDWKLRRTAWSLAPSLAIAASLAIATSGTLLGYWLARSSPNAEPGGRPAVFLTLGTVRAGPGGGTLILPTTDAAVVLRVLIESQVADRFDVVIKNQRGAKIDAIRNVRFDPSVDPALSVTVSSGVLSAVGEYVLEVRRIDGEVVEKFPFAVVNP
jgi:hypothetical protein